MNKKPTKNMSLRSHIAFFGFALFLLVLIGNLFWIQLINGEEYRLKAERNQLSDTIVNAHRGTIYDSNMKVIAQSASAWLVYINPSKITTDEQKSLLIKYFTENFELNAETIEKKVNKSSSGYEKIVGQISNDEKNALKEFIKENKDHKLNMIVGIDPDTKRYYPLGSFASTVVGFTGSGDTGRAGVELQYNEELTGKPGRIITAENALADAMPNDYETTYDAEQGHSLVLTIDEVIQYYLEQQLQQAVEDSEAKHAYGIVMDVKTGAILGMTTKPDYDLNEPYTITSNKVLEEIEALQDEDAKSSAKLEAQYSQWRNRVVSDAYDPGSVFKVIMAASALEEGVITTETTHVCTSSVRVADHVQSCYLGVAHGTITVRQALPTSCNTFFITLGQKMGKEMFFKYFEGFGFTETTGIDLPAEAAPVPGKSYYTLDKMGISELSSASFGQTFQVTPIQVITAVASLGNGGKLMKPYIVSKIIDENGNLVSENKPTVRRQVISEKTANLMRELMEEVCISGSAKNAYVAGYHVAGKTGTSEKLQVPGQNIASFAGYAPANDPQIAILVAIDEPRKGATTGGAIAAPIAGRILENVLTYLNVDPQYSDEELAKATVTAPNLVGIKANVVKSKASGFTVKVVGNGDTVVSQIPSAKQSMPKGGIIVVYTEENADKQTAKIPDLTNMSIAEANRVAVNSGFNIKVAGTTQGGEVVSYKQNITPGATYAQGTVITVYFRSKVNVAD